MTMKTSKISKKRGPSPIGSNTCTSSSSSSSSCARSVADIGDHGLPILSVISYHDELIVGRFLVTKLFRLSVHFVRCLPLFPLYSIFACLVHQSLYNQKTEVVLFLIVLSRNLLYPVISISSSFLFFSVHDILILLLM